MSTATATTQTGPRAEDARDGPQAIDLPARISMIERAGVTPKQRAAELLDAVITEFGGLAGTISAGVSGDELEHDQTADREGIDAWVNTLRGAALEARSHSRSVARLYGKDPELPEFAVIACPIDSAGRDPFGGLALLVPCQCVPEAERIQLHLRSACLLAAHMLAKPARPRREGVDMNDVARVFTRAGEFKTLHEFAYAITNALRQRFHCDLAAMGDVSRGRIRLLCVSGLDQIKRRNPGVHVIEQAMGECCDAAAPVVAQRADNWSGDPPAEHGKLHDRWRASTNGAAVLSIPVMSGDSVTAVVSFRRADDQPFDTDDIEAAQKLLAPLAGAVPLVAQSTRPLPAHAARSSAAGFRWLFKTGSIRKRLALLAALAAGAWWITASSPYRVSTPAAVVADRERVVAAPINGLVAGVLVRAGEYVAAGAPIATLDTAELVLQRDELAAEIASADLRLTSAVAENSPAEAAIARAEREASATRHRAVLDKIARASVKAPVDGIVVGPELADLTGQQIAAGQPICAIAEAGALSLELRIPESRVADLEPGGRIRFASHARPEAPGKTTLDRVAPASVQRDGKPVFIGEATLPADLDWLRPGMEGVAIVEIGERPNWWLATHRLTDAARMRFWID